MDNPLIDSLLYSLFETPYEERTPADAQAILLFVAEAAGIQLDGATNSHLEHLKLTAAVRHLEAETGFTDWRVHLVIKPTRYYLACNLTLVEATTEPPTDEVSVFASGTTAVDVLIELRKRLNETGTAAKAAA